MATEPFEDTELSSEKMSTSTVSASETEPLLFKARNVIPSRVNETDSDKPDDKQSSKVKQGVTNLLGIDATRVSDFSRYSKDIPGTVIKVIISIWFLVNLLGWKR